MKPLEVLRLVVSVLEQLEIPYMVGGSFASSIYGKPRITADVDLVINLKPEQAEEFTNLVQRDFYVDRGQIEQALRTRRSFNLVHLESSFKADLFILGERSFDQEEFSRRRPQPVESGSTVQMYVKTAEDTALSKLEWYKLGGEISETQWRDVVNILKAQARRLEFVYLRRWAKELGVSELLERAIRQAGIAEG